MIFLILLVFNILNEQVLQKLQILKKINFKCKENNTFILCKY